ncbi:YkvI family membrane protein [Vitreoscilla sp. C1]|uniref:YkvI family membrane protein n=1 Tax=Vitreoscilla sp. (strain C1) TaxID=96942 RepID=UPI00148EDD5F|nr:hypothetical protein [Vitreoscilla sp. C1]
MSHSISTKRVLTYAGAYIAFLIGSGFATGQEIVQYFSAYSWQGVLGTVMVFILFLYVGYEFVKIGHEKKVPNTGAIYTHICGPTIGRFYDYFAVLVIYMSFIVMLGGAGATVQQQYGIEPWIGSCVMAVMAIFTVVVGLDNMLKILGKIGPLIVILTITLGIWGTLRNPEGLMRIDEILPTMNLMTASTNWFFSAASYVGFCMLWLAGFMSVMGNSASNLREVSIGAALGASSFSLALILITLGLMANIELVGHSMIPSLMLASDIHPFFGSVFAIVVLAGVYTTAVPLLWQSASRFTSGKPKMFQILTLILTLIAIFVSLKVPFNTLVNVIYVINGYVGVILLFFMFYGTFKRIRTNKATRAVLASSSK